MAKDYSEQAFLKFCDYAANKGLWKKETARSRKSSSKRVLALLEPGEKGDLRDLDVDHLAERFANVEGTGFQPQSLSTYQARLKTALAEFIAWTDDPRNFKPASSNRASRKQTSSAQRQNESPTERESLNDRLVQRDSSNTVLDSGSLVFPIPIRNGLVIKLVGIPPDFSEVEAEKVASVVRALAIK